MMKIVMSFQLILATILVSRVTAAPRARPKRIINGVQLVMNSRNQNYVYPAIRYTVWIGNGMLAANEHWYKVTYANPDSLRCGGTLLTPDIVLTACTCICVFVRTRQPLPKYDPFERSSPLVNFENRFEVYFGEAKLGFMTHYILSKSYIIYERCRKHYFRAQPHDPEKRGFIPHVLHDYGLILMEEKIPNIYNQDPISYAPVSPALEIIDFYQRAVNKEYMCLSFGYGSHDKENGPNAQYLTYSWRPLMNYVFCYIAVYSDPLMKRYNDYYFNYTEDSEWACLSPLAGMKDPKRFITSVGDKGGPVTCNNEFFGIIGESFWSYMGHLKPSEIRQRVNFAFAHPIVHILYITAYEYHEEFLKTFHDRFDSNIHAPVPPAIDTDIIFVPTIDVPFYASRSPKISASINFVLISMFSLTKFLP